MLYKLLHIVFKWTQFIYFKKVMVVGQINIPPNEANLIIANHPSAFMDPILVGINIDSPIYYLAAEEFMGGKKMSKFLEQNFNMIPIYRPTTRPNETHKNTDSFEKCFEALNDKKSILIFAEGHSETQPWLDPLKSGTARIAIEVLQNNENLKEVNIVPLGLNYSNPHKFRSTFLLKIGKPIQLKQSHHHNKSTLTELSYEQLKNTMNGIDKDEADWQESLLLIYDCTLNTEDLEEKFKEQNKFIKELEQLKNQSNNQFEKIKSSTKTLVQLLEKQNITLNDFLTVKYKKQPTILSTLLQLLLFLPGFVLNIIPILITKYYVNQQEYKYSFEGSLYFAFGTLFMFLWHVLIVVGSFFIVGWYSFIVPLALIVVGIISIQFYDTISLYFQIKRLKNKIPKSVVEENTLSNLLRELNLIK